MTAAQEAVARSIIRTLKRVPLLDELTATPLYRHWRHQLTLALSRRRNRSFTQFMRLPTQYLALSGPVLDWVLPAVGDELRILVVGCSNGAEAYSIASVLLAACPRLRFRVRGVDIDEVQLARARHGLYRAVEVHDNPLLPAGFVEQTFCPQGERLQVRPEIASLASFERGNALDLGLRHKLGQAEILFAQNFLYHLRPRIAAAAFDNLVSLLAPRAALFVDGMDLGLRERLTRRHRLQPLHYQLEQIHEEARRGRGSFYPYVYFGLEPFRTVQTEWQRRYATIFLRG
jgi:chemotaxis methyl-accepting protein methylase